MRFLCAFGLKHINVRMASIGVKTGMGRVLNEKGRVRVYLVARTRKASADLSYKLTLTRYLVSIPYQTGHRRACTTEPCLYLARDELFSSWTSSNILSMFCFNLPLVAQNRLCAILSFQRTIFSNLAMHWWHSGVVDEIIYLYDKSIWSIRDLVRDIEIVRTLMSLLDLRHINDLIDRTGLQIKIWRQTSLYSTTLLVTHYTLPKHFGLPKILYHP